MEYDKNICPVINVDGVIASGKQFDLDITLPKDNRNVIYGIIRDCYKEPVRDAVVKLIEVVKTHSKEERKPVSHTFTDKEGEFVFGPLCPDKYYEIQIWANNVKHSKICAECKHEGSCLKGVSMNDCKTYNNYKPGDKCDIINRNETNDELIYENRYAYNEIEENSLPENRSICEKKEEIKCKKECICNESCNDKKECICKEKCCKTILP